MTQLGQRPKSSLSDRFATYFIGVAIGCLLTGWLVMRRMQARQQAQPQGTQQVEPAPADPPAPDTLTPPDGPATAPSSADD